MATPHPDPAALLAALLELDIDSLDVAGVRAAMGRNRLVESAVSSLDASLRARARQLTSAPNPSPTGPGPRPCPTPAGGIGPETLDGISGLAGPEGRRRDARSHLLARFPEFGDALRRGLCSNDHLDVLASMIARATPDVDRALDNHRDEMLGHLCALTPSQLRRWCDRLLTRIATELGIARDEQRRRSTRMRHWLDRNTGMGHIHGELDPDTYHRLTGILDAETGRRMSLDRSQDRDHVMAHALVDLVAGSAGTIDSTTTGPTVSVIIDIDTLLSGQHDGTVCEHPDGTWIDIATARDIATRASLVPVIVRNGTVPLAVGRRTRLATAGQRRALEAIHSTCAIPGCEVSITRCEAHHIDHWENGGLTELSNLVPLCSHHHHRVHADHWTISLDDRRTITVTRPDGTTVTDAPDRLPRAG
jgi:hypothetical protein